MFIKDSNLSQMTDAKWLAQWSDELTGARVLELGCGSGIDSQQLVNMAADLVASDLKLPVFDDPRITSLALDLRQPFRLSEQSFDLVVASLCLHYFDWPTTQAVVTQIHRVLKPKGSVIVRVNSRQDVHFGAEGFPQLEPGLYQVRGRSKRFFTEQDLHNLFARHWQISHVSHHCIDRYDKPKYLWQLKAEKRGDGHI